MGLLLSVLVFSVGVIEALSCYDRFRSGYLPLSYQRGRQHSQSISDILSKLEHELSVSSVTSNHTYFHQDNKEENNPLGPSEADASNLEIYDKVKNNDSECDDNDSMTSEDTVIFSPHNDTLDFDISNDDTSIKNNLTVPSLNDSISSNPIDSNLLLNNKNTNNRGLSDVDSLEDNINLSENVHIQRKLQRSVSEPSFQENIITGKLQFYANSMSVDDGLNSCSVLAKRNKDSSKKRVRFNLDANQICFDKGLKNATNIYEEKSNKPKNEKLETSTTHNFITDKVMESSTSEGVEYDKSLDVKTKSVIESNNDTDSLAKDIVEAVNYNDVSFVDRKENIVSPEEDSTRKNKVDVDDKIEEKQSSCNNEYFALQEEGKKMEPVDSSNTAESDNSYIVLNDVNNRKNFTESKSDINSLAEEQKLQLVNNVSRDNDVGECVKIATDKRDSDKNVQSSQNDNVEIENRVVNDKINENKDLVTSEQETKNGTSQFSGISDDGESCKGKDFMVSPEENATRKNKVEVDDKIEEMQSSINNDTALQEERKKIGSIDRSVEIENSTSKSSDVKKSEKIIDAKPTKTRKDRNVSYDSENSKEARFEDENNTKEEMRITRRRGAVKSKLVYDRSMNKGGKAANQSTTAAVKPRRRGLYKPASGTESEEDWDIEEVSDGVETESDNETAQAKSSISEDKRTRKTTDENNAADKAFWLIFSGEYTKAMSKDWHSSHFCCWQCDESLTGQRYVLREEHPYCIKCYESVFANSCEECSRVIGIDSKDLSYKDKHWHEACFLCSKCRVSLVDKQFGSKADKIYCGNCYDAQFASRCDGCGQIFRAGTKKMEYKTRQWHEQCFCCCVCKSPIGTKSFIPREQEIYCATCYEEKFATRCVKCNKIITSGGVTYKNEPWHRECFTCTNCGTSLAGQRFTSREDKPYCADCFGELFAKRCTACCKPITGIGGTRFISFEDRHWHNDCFICAACKTSLVGRGFITDGEDIICPDCAKQKLM